VKDRRRTEFIVGIFVIVALALVMFLVVKMGSPLFVREYRIVAFFEDAAGLNAGVQVSLAGVPVGYVKRLQLLSAREVNSFGRHGTLVKVELRIERKYDIPQDSELLLTRTAILGEQQLSFIPGKSDKFLPKDGSAVVWRTRTPLAATERVSEAIGELEGALKEFLEKTTRLIGDEQFQRDIKHSAANIAEVSARMGRLVQEISEAAATAREFLASASSLIDSKEVRSIITRADSLAGSLDKAASGGRLEAAVDAINRSAAGFQQIVERLQKALEEERGLVGALLKDRELGAEVKGAIREFRSAAADLEYLLPRAAAAAEEVRSLGQFLQANPSSIIFGRPGDVSAPYSPPPIR